MYTWKMTGFIVLALLTIGSTILAAPYNDGFAMAKPEKYIENYAELRHDISFEKVKGMKGKYCLQLRFENQKDAKFAKIPVKPGEKYEFSFRSKFVNSEIAENNSFLADLPFHNHRVKVPEVKILVAARKKIINIILTSGKWRRYRRIITIPAKGDFIQIFFNSGYNNGVLYIDDLKFKKLKTDKNDFEFVFDGNKYDYSGWQTVAGGSRMVKKNGEPFFFTAYGSTSEAFPLQPDTDYTLILTGKPFKSGTQGFGSVNFAKTGKKLGRKSLGHLKENSEGFWEIKFKTPKETAYGNLLLYNLLLKKISIKKENRSGLQ